MKNGKIIFTQVKEQKEDYLEHWKNNTFIKSRCKQTDREIDRKKYLYRQIAKQRRKGELKREKDFAKAPKTIFLPLPAPHFLLPTPFVQCLQTKQFIFNLLGVTR